MKRSQLWTHYHHLATLLLLRCFLYAPLAAAASSLTCALPAPAPARLRSSAAAVGGQSTNPRNTVNQLKRLLGKKFSDPHVQKDLEYFPFKVVAGPNGECMFEVSPGVAVAGRGGIPACCMLVFCM